MTYLFGAGASAYNMPTIIDVPKRILLAKEFIDKHYSFRDEERIVVQKGVEVPKEAIKSTIVNELTHLANQAGQQATIDTYAKTLFLQGRQADFDKLRFFLALYFCIEQKMSGTDLRYQNFMVSLLSQGSLRFPRQIKFLSWNYDLQMEAAFEAIFARGDCDYAFDMFNSENSEITELLKDEFTSVKLNGSSYWRYEGNLVPIIRNPFSSTFARDDLDDAMLYVYRNYMSNMPLRSKKLRLGFSWVRPTPNKITEAYDRTQILIVIGYSFPFFNREIDRTIIRGMTKIEKIYIQDPNAEDVKQSFLSILPEKRELPIFTLTAKSKQFFLPPEL